MGTNILEAICNLIEADASNVMHNSHSHNRMNSRGESLEAFIKDAFAGTIGVEDILEREAKYRSCFSYAGNQNNPPDFMIRGGDAVEVKKMENTGALSLNSSYPKTHLHSESLMISQSCRDAEVWTVKDFLYVVAKVNKQSNEMERLWLVYGDCYAAEAAIYEKPRRVIRESLALSGLELSQTNELGRINKVDPLGITDMRIRGMYLLKQPEDVFGKYLKPATRKSTRITAVMTKEKFLSFPSLSVDRLKVFEQQGLTITEVTLPDPNNSASAIAGVVIDWLNS